MKNSTRKIVYPWIFILPSVACVYACTNSGESDISISMNGSVKEVVSHSPEPLPAPWHLIPELSIGIDYGDENYMLRGPWGVTVLENGTCVILDSSPLQLRLYDPEGVFLREFGRSGRGPDDLIFSGPFSTTLRPAGADRFELWSNWPLRMQTWTIEGSLEDIQTMPDDHLFLKGRRPRVLRLLGSDIFGTFDYYERLESGELMSTSYLLISDWNGTRCDTLSTVKGSYDEMTPEAGMAQAAMDYTPENAYLVTRAGRIYLSKLTEDWVQEVDPHGRGVRLRFRWEHEPDAIPETLVEEFTRNLGKSVGEGAAWLREHVYLIYLAEGPQGEIWVQRTGEPDEQGVYPTDVFSNDGTYRGRLLLPFAARLQFIDGRRLYAIGSTDGGAPTLVRYRLEPAG